MHLDSRYQLDQTKLAIDDAEKRFGSTAFQWLAWPQEWPNSGCGRAGSGMVMHSFWHAQTVICSCDSDEVLVYHNGEFAYAVERPTQAFWIQCGQRKLPGERDWPRLKAEYDFAAAADREPARLAST